MRTEKTSIRSNRTLISAWLEHMRFKVDVLANSPYCGDWKISLSGHVAIPFHIVGQGGCLLKTRTAETVMQEGDWVFFPRDEWHEVLPLPGSDQPTILLCGSLKMMEGEHQPLLDWLPDIWLVRRADRFAQETLQLVTRLFLIEANSDFMANKVVLGRLCETLFVMLVRQYVEALDDHSGLAPLTTDPGLTRALQAMHQRPEDEWCLERLAGIAGMSRTRFAVSFTQALGQSPMDYLARWRMNQAVTLLRQQQPSVARIAEKVGYQSEPAFRKAFKRIMGRALSAFRVGSMPHE